MQCILHSDLRSWADSVSWGGCARPWALQRRLQTEWPVLVDQLAATLETNLQTDPSRVVVSQKLATDQCKIGWRGRRRGAR